MTSSYKVVKKNQLVVGFPIDEGVIYVQNHDAPGIMSPAYNVWNIDLGRVDPSYLEFALHSPRTAIGLPTASIKMPRNRTAMKEDIDLVRWTNCEGWKFRISCCSADRSRLRVVNTLDDVRSLIEGANGQIAMLDTLVKSRFVEMFGGLNSADLRPLKDVCSIITDGTHQPPKFVDRGIPFLFVSNITSDAVDYETNKFISVEDYEQLIRRTPIEVGDVLVSAVGSFGHPAIVEDDRPFCFQRHIAYLKPRHDLIDSSYLHAALLSEGSQRYMDRCAKGAAQRTVTLKSFKEMKVPLPPLALQQEFASFVAEVDKSRFNLLKAYGSIIALFRVLFP